MQEELDKWYNETNVAKSIDLICNFFDTKCLEGKFNDCSEALKLVDHTKLSTSQMRMILVMTYPAKDKLEGRELFYAKVYTTVVVTKGKAYADDLFKNCE